MSSVYSGQHGPARASTVASTKSIDRAIKRTQAWTAAHPMETSRYSASSSISEASNRHDDLDIDTLFKRLDRYTQEMQEVGERLKRARSMSVKSASSDHYNIDRFSYENHARPRLDLMIESSLRRSMSLGRASQGTVASRQSLRQRSRSRSRSTSRHHSEWSTRRASQSWLSFSREQSIGPRIPLKSNMADAEPHEQFMASLKLQHRNFDAWHLGEVEISSFTTPPRRPSESEEVPSAHEPVRRSSSKYSNRQSLPTSTIGTNPKLAWRQKASSATAPNPALKDSRRTPSLEKAPSMDSIRLITQDFSFDSSGPSLIGGPDPIVNNTLDLPPRTSSRKVSHSRQGPDEPLPAPPTRRRMTTTTEGRPTIRNGGFWSEQMVGAFSGDVDAESPVPELSASNSNATLKDSPPSTPLTFTGFREDQIRRELETASIHEGVEALEKRYKKRRPPMLRLDKAIDDEDEKLLSTLSSPRDPETPGLQDTDDRNGRHPRRRKSIFQMFQRRSPVEKLIDMYLDDTHEDKTAIKRTSTWSRKNFPVSPMMPNSPALPPMPVNHGQQTSS
jgi:hypothetical protein